MARPSKLTPRLQRRLVAMTRAGIYLGTSAPLVGVSRQAVHSWLRRGDREIVRQDSGKPPRPAEKRYVEFTMALRQAQAYANIRDMAIISEAAKTDPHWALKRFKLRNPERFKGRVNLG
jgi:hypothetical protein